MIDYEFTLKFSLPDVGAEPGRHIDALFAAGCEDALIGMGQSGRIVLDFTRSAKSAFAAVSSALRDVRKAIPGATLVEASPDFVGLTDVADIVGFSRQNMRKLMLGSISTFPIPVHEGKPALWHLANILSWISEQQARPIDAALLEVATANMTVNIARQARSLKGAILPRELERLFA